MRTNVSKAYCAFSVMSSKSLDLLVDLIGIEPMTSSMPWKRAPSCATGPHKERYDFLIFAALARFVNARCRSETIPIRFPPQSTLLLLQIGNHDS